jgi:serine-type D-Ala-D-Ala carboxypeptidase (penicillin-binding protein 5/6)
VSARVRAALVAAVLVLAALLVPGVASAQSADPPACRGVADARAAITVEASTGTVVCASDADRELPIGSTTKLMTALLTLERVPRLSARMTASSYRPAPIESQIGLIPGERMTVADLLRGLLVESGNDAAMTLAEGVAGSERRFVRLMNQRARQLGLSHTSYENPIGLDDPENYSSARDLVTLAAKLRESSFARRVVDSPSVTLRSGRRTRTFANQNDLIGRVPYVDGVKTGHTGGAGYVLVGSASRKGIRMLTAVVGAPSEPARDADTLTLLRAAFPRYQRIRAVVKGRVLARVPIRDRNGAQLRLVASRTVRRVVERGERDRVRVAITAPTEVSGPVRRGQTLGRAVVSDGGTRIAEVPLVAASSLAAAGITQKTRNWFTSPGVLAALALAVVGGSVLIAHRRRRPSKRDPRQREARAA